ncbi:sensor histidine kinase [Paenibacillus sp. 481]|uniref:sensor histidine kinase n=1 Tax=Paenibacillus sp. 481 TaxID=2835869 RepID=UPI001E501D76|nr:sensor histidine kinase [Paenibacillus sp. 481]UHA72833.1 sensor histidine kinase [Paenibacillus sp. 481]
MTFWQYCRDRLRIIAACLVAVFISLVVVWLDLGIGQRYIRSDSLIYIFILATCVIVLGLLYDYKKMRPWYVEMNHASASLSESEFTLCLQHPATKEQQQIHELITRQYQAFTNDLIVMRQQREQHVHFTNQWVHHMKTPVSVIHLLTQQHAGPMTHEQAEQLMHSIAEEADRLTRGLDMMLHTARLDKFELDLHVSRLNLQQMIRQVINQNRKALIRYHIYPKVSGADVFVESDEKWLVFILTQLVTNAIKYSKHLPGTKTLQFQIEVDENAILLHVNDEGIGIAEHDLPRVFDPFFTGENGRREGDATGMGLYLVKKVTANLGHTISIRSKVNEGTSVTLRFAGDSLYRNLM